MERIVEITSDGSRTLYVPALDEHYHSVKGAVTESAHVFIRMGLEHHPSASLKVLEVGFGTGLNAFLTCLSAERLQKRVHYTAIELYPLPFAVAEALGENYWPNTAITPEMLEGTFGITSDLYEDYMGEMPMISTNVDTLLIIKAKSDKVDAVEEALNEYRDNLINNTTQYPMNLGKIQASRIERLGDYVCFVQLGADTTAASESGDEAVITQCQEQNELAIEILSRNVEH